MIRTIDLVDRTVIVYFKDSFSGKQYDHCNKITWVDEGIELIYDYKSPNSFGCTSYTKVLLQNIDEIKIY